MAGFIQSRQFSDLVDRYRSRIEDGTISQRGLADEAGISRHKARIIIAAIDYEVLVPADEDYDDDIEEQDEEERLAQMDAVAKDVLRRYLAGASPIQGFHTSDGAPEVAEIHGVTAHEPENLDDLLARAVALFDKTDDLRKRKNDQRIVFTGGPVALVFSGDEHFGGSGTNVKRMLDEARIVNATDGMYHVRMGDFVNQFILGRMRAIRDTAHFTIKEEWLLASMLIDLIAPKLLAVVGGNHDFWAAKASGMDRLKDILPEGILYDPNEVRFTIHVGEAKRTIRLRHKWRGSSVFNPTHGIEVAAQRDKADFDVAVAAHTHQAGLVREFFAQGRRKLAVLCNTFKQMDSYVDEEGFARSDSSSTCSTIIFEEDGTMFGAPSLEWAAAYMKLRHAQ